jgi:NAD(P)-dependent dehydrogenase (short-subunit alcohol dehydrogenase family)
MSPSAIVSEAASVPTNGHSNAKPEIIEQTGIPPYVSTMPDESFDWKVSLKNKVIAVTGANRGIGLGLAQVFLANEAAHVYSLDLFEPGEEFEALQKAFPKRVHYLNCNVTSEESVTQAIDQIVAQSGAIHGMVANAGMTKHQPALDFDKAQLEQMFNLNVFGAYYCATAAAKKFIELGIKGSVPHRTAVPRRLFATWHTPLRWSGRSTVFASTASLLDSSGHR